MYSADYRARVATYDRMRKDQEKIGSLINKARELKGKIKSRRRAEESDQLRGSSYKKPRPRQSLSPSRMPLSASPPRTYSASGAEPGVFGRAGDFDLLDPRMFSSMTMKSILGQTAPATPFISNDMAALITMPIQTPSDPFSQTTTSIASANRQMTMSSVRFSTSGFLDETARSLPSSPNRVKPPLPHSVNHRTPRMAFSSPSIAVDPILSMNNSQMLQAQAAVAVYNQHYQGLQSIGPSGMTILEEMIDAALRVCEKSRISGQTNHSRAATLLSSSGKLYSGCDVQMPTAESHSISAERSAFLTAVADGASNFDGLVICSDTMRNFPTPDGLSREFMRSFGNYPVILVNCDLEIKQTSSQELFPINSSSQIPPQTPFKGEIADRYRESADGQLVQCAMVPPYLNSNVAAWSVDDVQRWLHYFELDLLMEPLERNKADGALLLRMDEAYAVDVLQIRHTLKRRRLMRLLDRLKVHQMEHKKDTTLDALDEYMMSLEKHKLKLVAKLKAVFDRFDTDKAGRLSAEQIEQVLLYMNRSVDNEKTKSWINRLKSREREIEFSEFVEEYSTIVAGEDPDVEDDKRNAKVDNGTEASPRSSPSNRRYAGRFDSFSGSDSERQDYARQRNDRRQPFDEGSGDVLSIKLLAELKGVFDRFAIDDMMTVPETCQALTEGGIITPRSNMAQYLRGRKHLGTKRSVTFFEFIRAYAALRPSPPTVEETKRTSNNDMRRSGPLSDKYLSDEDHHRKDFDRVRDRDSPQNYSSRRFRYNSPQISSSRRNIERRESSSFEVGMKVEVNYRGRGKYFPGKITRDRGDGTFDVLYDDGDSETRVKENRIKPKYQDEDRNRYKTDREFDRDFESNRGSYRRNDDSDEWSRRRDTRRSYRDFEPGDRVEIETNRGRGRIRLGKILRRALNGNYRVELTDGSIESDVDERNIMRADSRDDHRSPRTGSSLRDGRDQSPSLSRRRPRLEEGAKVEANYRGKGKYFPGKITRDRGDGTFDVLYDDGDSETRVKEEWIRLLDDGRGGSSLRDGRDQSPSLSRRRPRLEEGAKVEANYRGKGKYFPGKITRDRGDGTFDVLYDDGDSETRVKEEWIRLLDVPSTSVGGSDRRDSPSKWALVPYGV